jgi:hypothetical protein
LLSSSGGETREDEDDFVNPFLAALGGTSREDEGEGDGEGDISAEAAALEKLLGEMGTEEE